MYLSLLLKDDWERVKKEVVGEPVKGIIVICLSLAIVFSWIGIFEVNRISATKNAIVYTSSGMITIIVGMLVSFLIINMLIKQNFLKL